MLRREPRASSERGFRVALGMGWGVFALAAFSVVFVFGGKDEATPAVRNALLLSGGLLLVGTASSLYALRVRAKLDGFILAHLFIAQAVWTALVYLSGGAGSGATSLYGLTALAGGLLLELPGVVVASVAGFVFYALMVALLTSSAIPIPSDIHRESYLLSAEESTYYLVANFFVLLLVALLASYLIERLQRAGGELRAAESRAAAAEQLALLGRLAAGLAHEIRNPLSSIAASVQLLRTTLTDEDRELCEIVLREAKRLDELVSDMTNLSRPRLPDLRAVDARAVALDVVTLASQSGRGAADVEVRLIAAPEAVFVTADPGQLRQLVWNLVRNAVQASEPGGEVRVRLDPVPRGVRLSVEDDGEGISSDARARLFDAFYTTRSHGTGVGLAVVKKIAEEHGFPLSVDSESGRGAAFRVILPGPALETSEGKEAASSS